MLISDWSSDVCSSDLSESARKPNAGAGLRTIGTPDSTIVPRLIARYLARLIARHHSQVFPKLSPCRLRHGPERQQFHAVVGHPLDAQDVTGQRLPRDERAQIAGEVVGLRGAAGFLVQVAEVELPAVCLLAAVLAHQSVQPPPDAAGQPEGDRKRGGKGKRVSRRVE